MPGNPYNLLPRAAGAASGTIAVQDEERRLWPSDCSWDAFQEIEMAYLPAPIQGSLFRLRRPLNPKIRKLKTIEIYTEMTFAILTLSPRTLKHDPSILDTRPKQSTRISTFSQNQKLKITKSDTQKAFLCHLKMHTCLIFFVE